MKRRDFSLAAAALASIPAALTRRAQAQSAGKWEVLADIAESCSCEIPCPCNFGRPTTLQCNGSRLFEITGGHFGGAEIQGISFVVTFEMGKWTKIYLDESLDMERSTLFTERLLPAVFAGFDRLKLSLDRAPIDVQRTASTVRFAVPESEVEMEVLRGLDGKAITIDGLPSPMFFGYTQYKSVIHRHSSAQASFSHQDTNAFTSQMIAAGDV
jgi:hypothetical protein